MILVFIVVFSRLIILSAALHSLGFIWDAKNTSEISWDTTESFNWAAKNSPNFGWVNSSDSDWFKKWQYLSARNLSAFEALNSSTSDGDNTSSSEFSWITTNEFNSNGTHNFSGSTDNHFSQNYVTKNLSETDSTTISHEYVQSTTYSIASNISKYEKSSVGTSKNLLITSYSESLKSNLATTSSLEFRTLFSTSSKYNNFSTLYLEDKRYTTTSSKKPSPNTSITDLNTKLVSHSNNSTNSPNLNTSTSKEPSSESDSDLDSDLNYEWPSLRQNSFWPPSRYNWPKINKKIFFKSANSYCNFRSNPYYVTIFRKSLYEVNCRIICGGSLLSSYFVLTAAHCVPDFADPCRESIVIAGETFEGHNPYLQQKEIERYFIHPQYEQTTHYDIGLALLKEPIYPSAYVKFVSLPKYDPRTNRKCKERILGLGIADITYHDGDVSKKNKALKCAVMKIVNVNQCDSVGEKFIKQELCAIATKQIGIGSCLGDSGGPIMCGNLQIGIAIEGFGCAEVRKPTSFTNLLFFKEFIRNVMYRVKFVRSCGCNRKSGGTICILMVCILIFFCNY